MVQRVEGINPNVRCCVGIKIDDVGIEENRRNVVLLVVWDS